MKLYRVERENPGYPAVYLSAKLWMVIHDHAGAPLAFCTSRSAAERVATALNAAARREKKRTQEPRP